MLARSRGKGLAASVHTLPSGQGEYACFPRRDRIGGMVDQPFLTARIDDDSGPESNAGEARVPWWSFTKTALATAALRLVAQGRLRLDDPVDRYPYTLRQLLQHRAGVPNYGDLAAYHEAVRRGDKPWSVEELLHHVAAHRLDFDPGLGWRYSNVGYLVVRQMIEEATGRDIGDALRHLVFDPLGLDTVRLVTTAEDLAGTAWGNRDHYDPGWVYHGLLAGSPADAVRFLHQLLCGDILPRELLTDMTRAHPIGGRMPDRPWETTGYGLGLMIGQMRPAGLAIGHSGASPESVSAVYHFGDRPRSCTVAAFAAAPDEGLTEHEVARLAGPA
jgi:D-alanyl-D-alanine carboxypeptidase